MRRADGAVLGILFGALLLCGCPKRSGNESPPVPPQGGGEAPTTDTTVPATLYCLDLETEKLSGVTVDIPAGSLEERATALIELMATGELPEGKVGCLPVGAALQAVSLSKGTLTLDFNGQFTEPSFWAGSGTELLRVWGIVDTVTGLEGVERVQFLVEGEAIESLGGHVELLEPLSRDESLIGDD